MKKLNITALVLMVSLALVFTACSSDPETDTSKKDDVQPSVSLEGNFAVVGSNFDEATASILSGAKGTRCSVSLTDETLPAGVKTVFIDWDSLQTIGYDLGGTLSIPTGNLDRLFNWTQQGATLVFHKPESWSVYTILLHIQERLANTESIVGSSTTQSLVSNQIGARTAAESDEFGEFEYDIIAIKPDASAYYLHDVYAAGNTNTVSVETTESTYNENGELDESEPETKNETTVTVTATEPTAEQFALYASETVKWLNETESESQSRFARAAEGANISGEELLSQVCSETRTISLEIPYYDYEGNQVADPPTITLPLTVRAWTTALYNFDKDEDYYHVMLEEEFDPAPIYKGTYHKVKTGNWNEVAGYTLKGMDLRASRYVQRREATDAELKSAPLLHRLALKIFGVYEDSYEVGSQWNILPRENAGAVTTESIDTWNAGMDISGTVKGVSGKLSASYKAEKHVKTIENDVTVIDHTDEYGMHWEYTFGQQLSYTGKPYPITFTLHEPARDSASRKKSYQQQSWNWIIKGTAGKTLKERGENPFIIDFRLASLKILRAKATESYKDIGIGQWKSVKTSTDTYEVGSNKSLLLMLPVPERFKHVYSLTTDEIADVSEFNNLMTALKNVSSKFDQLHAKLIRKDSEGNLCGRTGVTDDAIKNMVGQEWYALAHEIEGKRITVSKPYKFYVKDENDNKLNMIQYNSATSEYKAVGKYLVIDTDGIKITNE